VAALVDERARRLDRLRHRLDELEPPPPEIDGAARDSRHVEEIVDEANEMRHLPLDDRDLARRRVGVPHAEELRRRQDRRERIAQLVTEHRRQELVLRTARRRRGRLGRLGSPLRGDERRHVVAEDEDSVSVADRRRVPVERALDAVGILGRQRVHEYRLATAIRALGGVPDRLAAGHVAERLAERLAESVGVSEERAMARVRQHEAVLGASRRSENRRGLRDEVERAPSARRDRRSAAARSRSRRRR
jgi:hypothetical protein